VEVASQQGCLIGIECQQQSAVGRTRLKTPNTARPHRIGLYRQPQTPKPDPFFGPEVSELR